MKPIKLAQFGSTIAIMAVVAYTLTMGTWVLLKHPDRMGYLIQQVTVMALFIAPEKLAALFGPALKRKQENDKIDKQST